MRTIAKLSVLDSSEFPPNCPIVLSQPCENCYWVRLREEFIEAIERL
jgi:hypothetical protein